MLVGRDGELALLRERIAANTPTIVAGEAGVGKTALIRAAADDTAVEGGALATLEWMPYVAIERALGRRLPDADATWVAGELVAHAAGRCLLLDDAQWAHSSTLEVLSLLAGRLPILVALRTGEPRSDAALDRLTSTGFARIDLGTLDAGSCGQLVRQLRPGASDNVIERLWRRTGGNPLLVEELSATDEPSDTLRLAIAARLRGISDDARKAVALLALAGRPLGTEAVGDADELRSLGLVIEQPEGITLRHALIAEVVVETLPEEERMRLHAHLASVSAAAGERARHLAAAGNRTEALVLALEAADATEIAAERAAHLAVAAQCASGPEADDLRIRAADQVLQHRTTQEAEAILDQVQTTDPVQLASVHHMRARIAWARGQHAEHLRELDAGLGCLDGQRVSVAVELHIDRSRYMLAVGGDAEQAVTHADEAVAIARALQHEEPRALAAVGLVQMFLGEPSTAKTTLSGVFDQAIEEQDHEVAFHTGAYLRIAFKELGDAASAAQVDSRLVDLAQRRRRTGLELKHRSALLYHRNGRNGRERTVADARALLDRPISARVRDDARFELCMTLNELGHFDELFAELDRAEAEGLDDGGGRGAFLRVRAEAEIWNGKPKRAIEIARACTANEAYAVVWKVDCVWIEAFACFDLAQPTPPAPSGDLPASAPSAAQVVELRALELTSTDLVAAAGLFTDAAERWAGAGTGQLVSENRCRWAAGELYRRAGDEARAKELLALAETAAVSEGLAPHLARIHRSLRLLGEHRSAKRRGGGDELTERQREIVDLVAEGLTNADIARRLGLSRSTVARQLATAMSKLGVTTRAQAATRR